MSVEMGADITLIDPQISKDEATSNILATSSLRILYRLV